jgi:hypothetical protein
MLEFQVCRQGRDSRWVVRLGNAVYGAYLDKEQALLDAVEAADGPRGAGLAARQHHPRPHILILLRPPGASARPAPGA